MQIKTRDFGIIEAPEDCAYTFVQPIFGFEEYTRYAVIMDREEIGNHFAWLQSLEEPTLCFLMAKPELVMEDYVSSMGTEPLKAIGSPNKFDVWVMMVLPEEYNDATINLKSPILLNLESQSAAQVILENDYPVRYKIAKSDVQDTIEEGKEQ